MTSYYAGIGSRKTPPDVLNLFTRVAKRLEELGFVLRSGGAAGADSAFEAGVTNPTYKQIFLPWTGFNFNTSLYQGPSEAAFIMASEFHPAWNRLTSNGRKFHARNCHQVLGIDLNTPVEFIVCWTPGGAIAGGTGQALRIAKAHDIPVFNFGVTGIMDVLSEFILSTPESLL